MLRIRTGLFIALIFGLVIVVLLMLPQPTTAPGGEIGGEIELTYQAFADGFVVWRADRKCAYVYVLEGEYSPGNIFIPQNIPVEGIPAQHYYCLEVPDTADDAIAALLNQYPDAADVLGQSTGESQRYTRPSPTPPTATFGGGPFHLAEIFLPDGQVLWCGYRAATAHSCSIGPLSQ